METTKVKYQNNRAKVSNAKQIVLENLHITAILDLFQSDILLIITNNLLFEIARPYES